MCVLIDTSNYTYSDNHVTLADVPLTMRVATSGTLASRTTTLGVLDAADVTFTAVTGNRVQALAVYKSSGTAASSPLIAYFDQASGLPVTPDGGNITIVWDNGSRKVAML